MELLWNLVCIDQKRSPIFSYFGNLERDSLRVIPLPLPTSRSIESAILLVALHKLSRLAIEFTSESLPPLDEFNSSTFWTTEELKRLQGTHAYELTKKQQFNTEQVFQQLVLPLFEVIFPYLSRRNIRMSFNFLRVNGDDLTNGL